MLVSQSLPGGGGGGGGGIGLPLLSWNELESKSQNQHVVFEKYIYFTALTNIYILCIVAWKEK